MKTAIAASLVLLLCGGCSTARRERASEIAVTFDDLPVVTAKRDPAERQQAITAALLETLRSRQISAVGFVNGDKLMVDDALDHYRIELLQQWLDAGMELGNHTFAHGDLHRIGAEQFEQQIIEGETALRELTEVRYFRHPFLHTGRSATEREAVEQFLTEHHYRTAPVTIDNSDWIFARAFDEAEARSDRALREQVETAYVEYMLAKVSWFDAESVRLFGRRIRQVLLVHANGLNAAAFGTLADALRRDGHRFISLDRALEDEAYRSPDAYFGPGGISWLDRWAITAGKPRSFFAGEPATPAWIMRLAKVTEE